MFRGVQVPSEEVLGALGIVSLASRLRTSSTTPVERKGGRMDVPTWQRGSVCGNDLKRYLEMPTWDMGPEILASILRGAQSFIGPAAHQKGFLEARSRGPGRRLAVAARQPGNHFFLLANVWHNLRVNWSIKEFCSDIVYSQSTSVTCRCLPVRESDFPCSTLHSELKSRLDAAVGVYVVQLRLCPDLDDDPKAIMMLNVIFTKSL